MISPYNALVNLWCAKEHFSAVPIVEYCMYCTTHMRMNTSTKIAFSEMKYFLLEIYFSVASH